MIASNRRTLVREAVPQYLAYLDSLGGTRREKSPRSIEDIKTKLAKYIEPALGHRPVSAVTEQEIRDLALSVKGKSRSTVANVLSTASGFFKWAKREKLTGINPVSVARDVFGEELLPDTEPKQARALSDGEIARAMEHLSDTFLPIVSLAAETGLRISEVIGLRVGSFDAEAETLTVDAQLAKDGSVRKTKTKRERTIPVTAKAAAVIRQQIERLGDEGYRNDGEALIFVTKSGRPQSRRNILRAWQNALQAVGVEGACLHSLRHSFVSRLAERNVPVAFASELVGHTRVQTTVDVYTRVRGGRDERVEKLREVLA